jgi:hypothetical protein
MSGAFLEAERETVLRMFEASDGWLLSVLFWMSIPVTGMVTSFSGRVGYPVVFLCTLSYCFGLFVRGVG